MHECKKPKLLETRMPTRAVGQIKPVMLGLRQSMIVVLRTAHSDGTSRIGERPEASLKAVRRTPFVH